MYIIMAFVMLIRGFADANMMRTSRLWLLAGEGHATAPLRPIFTAHGVIMIFVAMPFVVGLMNIAVPLQIGARRCVPVPEQPELLGLLRSV